MQPGDQDPSAKRAPPPLGKAETAADMPFVLGVSAPSGGDAVTARKAGGIRDMKLPVSPFAVKKSVAMQNLAKAINISLQTDFLPSELEPVYKAARVYRGTVQIVHRDYIGLGDGVFAQIGKLAKSFQLTLRGPDPASPEGQAALENGRSNPAAGLINLMGRKLDLLQEYENKVPTYVEQTLDRLEAANMIEGWNREEWSITTTVIGLDVIIRPVEAVEAA